jgi:hypothetical protein
VASTERRLFSCASLNTESLPRSSSACKFVKNSLAACRAGSYSPRRASIAAFAPAFCKLLMSNAACAVSRLRARVRAVTHNGDESEEKNNEQYQGVEDKPPHALVLPYGISAGQVCWLILLGATVLLK